MGYWLLRYQGALLTLAEETPGDGLPRGEAGDFGATGRVLPVGDWRGVPCHAADIEALPALPALQATPLRQIFARFGMEAFALAGRAVQLLDWQRDHRHCGRCGTPNARDTAEFAMHCPACGLVAYPRISPAVMVLVRRGGELLLARSHRFPPGVYSALAGFVEPGETLEQCAAREVREEVGIEIANLRYFGSQPWPFPNSLMAAFFADYAGGDLRPDATEIEAAGWFGPDRMPLLPEPVTIARSLIDAARGVDG